MIEKYNTVRVNNRILELFSDLSWLKEKVDDLVNNPSTESAQEVDSMFSKFAVDSEALRNSITTLAKEVTDSAVDENGEMEIDVVQEAVGLRLS